MEDKVWHNHYPKEISRHYDYPKHNLAQFLVDTAAHYPQHWAIDFFGKKTNYQRLLEDSRRFANALQARGIAKGDRVALMLPNCPQTVAAFFGILMSGAIVVQTNPLYKERELEHHMGDCEAAAIVTLDSLYPRIAHIREKTKLKHIFLTKLQSALPFPKNLLYAIRQKTQGNSPRIAYSDGVESLEGVLANSASTPIMAQIDGENDLALLQYTGGTTGGAKGVMLTHCNLIANTIQTKVWSSRIEQGKEKYLAALPFFHVFGMTVLMNQSVYTAGELLIVPKFEAEAILKLIERERPTIFPGAPTMYIALINHPDIQKYDLSSIQYCISGSAPLPLEVQERFEKLTGGRLIEGYGLSEASPVTHCNTIWEKRKSGSIGIPFPDTDARVVHMESDEELKIGEVGELVIKGPQVMKGYWNRPAETIAALRNGWLHTGDLAVMDEEGFFYIMDRKKDLIIAGGFNIYPREIEEVLFEHPGVMDAVAVGIPDQYRGETVKAFIVPKAGVKLSEKEMEAWCRERLAAFKVPRFYEFRTELPKTFVGKVLRRKLQEEETEKKQHRV